LPTTAAGAWTSFRPVRTTVLLLLTLTGLLAGQTSHASATPWLNGESRPEDLSVFLVTFGPGSDVPSWFGHGALGVEDKRLHRSWLYNYGMFSFDETMLARFVMGRLWFWVAETSVPGTFRLYKNEGRSVRVQTLALEPEKAAALAKALAVNTLPENRHYRYHHYDDNCSTRLRDIVDQAIGGQLHQATQAPARMTLRDHTRRYTAVFAPLSLLLDFWMNDEIDRPIAQWDEAFLPDELEAQLAKLQYVNASGQRVPIVASQWTYSESVRPPPPAQPPVYWPWTTLTGLMLGALAYVVRNRRVALGLLNALVGLVFGFAGTGLAIMWAFTEHTVTWRNENIWLANPITFLAFPLGLALAVGARRTGRWLTVIWGALTASAGLYALVKVTHLFAALNQDTWRLIPLMGLCSLGMFLAHWRGQKNIAAH